MPSTLAGLVLFAVALAPGLVFVLAQQRVAPHQTLSAFRETAVVVCVSIAVDVVVLAAFAGSRAIRPHGTPDVGRLVRDPSIYLRESYLLVFWWSVALLVVAVALAAWVGSGAARRGLSRLPGVSLVAQAAPHESRSSAWWLLFRDRPGIRVHLGCTLVDGSFVSGWLLSYNPTWPELKELFEAATVHGRAEQHFRGIFDRPLHPAPGLQQRVDDILDNLVTSYDEEEAPHRRRATELQAIIDHDGNKVAAAKAVAAQVAVHDSTVDFLTGR